MALLYLLVLWVAAACAAVCGALLSYNVLQTRFRRQLESAEAKWHLRHQQDSPGTVIENVSVGWLNLLLQSLWTPVLEKHVAGLTTELLQKVFVEVLEKGSQKAPWKYLDSIEVEELGFGLVPPTFQVVAAKFDPTASMLTLSMDVRFTSNSAQAVLLVRSKNVGLFAPVTVRLEVTHVKLRGRLRLGILLGQEAPGIQGVYYSFTSPPHLDVAVRPLGLPLPSVVPGVDTALRGVLSKLIGRRMVEPQRRYLDVHRIYMNKHIARVGGPGGLLRVMVLNASNLCPPGQQQQAADADSGADALRVKGKTGGKPTSASASNTVKLSSYCEVTFGQTVLRTPIAHHAGAALADWNWQFSLALPFELDKWPVGAASGSNRGAAAGEAAALQRSAGLRRSSGGGADASDELCLAVYDAQTVGQPVLLGKTKVSLCPLQLQPNGPARTLVLPLHKASNNRAAVQLHVQWLKSTKRPSPGQPQQQQQQARRVQQGQRISIAPAAAKPQQPLTQQPVRTSPQPERSVSAFAVSNKGVSWQDKTQLRVKSATAAAKKSLRQFVGSSGSSSTGSDKLQHAAEAVAAESHHRTGSGDAAVNEPQQQQQQQQQGGGPWSSPAAAASADKPPRSATSSGSHRSNHAQHAAAAVDALVGATAHAAVHSSHSQRGMSAASPDVHTANHAADHAAAATGASWLSPYGWTGLGSWIWPASTTNEPASELSSHLVDASVHHVSTSPWPTAAGEDDERPEDEEEDWLGMQSAASDLSNASSSPLALLSHVVHMQRELEQQRAQLAAVQQQLEHTSNSYQRLKQICRHRGREALLQGARFLLHKSDGSTQHVLLYLTHPGSSRGQASRLGRQQQQPDPGMVLAIAALPETRREARAAYRRMASGLADGPEASEGSNHSAQSAPGGATGGVSQGGSPTTPSGRLSAFGSVGAGLRLRMQRGTILQLGYESGKLPRSALQQLKSIPASQLVGVVRGRTHFPAPTNGASVAGGLAGNPAECFTVLVQEDSRVTAINLQLPTVGNGRNLDEWLLAVRDVAAGGQPAVAAVRDISPVAAAVPAVPAAVPAVPAAGAAAAGGQRAAATTHLQGSTWASEGVGGKGGQDEAAAVALMTAAVADASAYASLGSSSGVDRSSSSTAHVLPSFNAQHAAEPAAPDHEKHASIGGAAGGAGGPVLASLRTTSVASADSPVDRTDSATQQTMEARDWLLPAAAKTTPQPWAGGTAGSTGGADDDSSSSGSDDTDTNTDM